MREIRITGLRVHFFGKSLNTPHIRVGDRVDYWPTTGRWYDTASHSKGKGFETLKTYLLKLFPIRMPVANGNAGFPYEIL